MTRSFGGRFIIIILNILFYFIFKYLFYGLACQKRWPKVMRDIGLHSKVVKQTYIWENQGPFVRTMSHNHFTSKFTNTTGKIGIVGWSCRHVSSHINNTNCTLIIPWASSCSLTKLWTNSTMKIRSLASSTFEVKCEGGKPS